MYPGCRYALQAYTNVGIDTGIAAANPHRLILMLFEGAQVALLNARRHLKAGEIPEKASALNKALMIIDHGLKASLDVKSGGELGENLVQLYEYMCRRLLHANLKNDDSAIEEVNRLLSELHEAWKQIGQTPQTAVNATATTAYSNRV